MSHKPQIAIPALYMRGGTSKGIFFRLSDLPDAARQPGPARDALLLRVTGSPDPYGKHTDGMGGATSSTSKVVILSESTQPGHDVDYLFGQVSIDRPVIDWSGNCGNLTAAVGACAIHLGLLNADRVPDGDGMAIVRIWQANIGKTILAHVPVVNGHVQETGDFELDGVTFPSAEVKIDFIDPVDSTTQMFPTGNLVDSLDVPGVGAFRVTMINAGIPTIFLEAGALGYSGTELQEDINADEDALHLFEKIRACGAVQMGLIEHVSEAESRQHTPKVAIVAPATSYETSSGKTVHGCEIDLLVRALSMGRMHHAMMGTAAVAIGTAASIPGTLVHEVSGGCTRDSVIFGHPSGTLRVGAETLCHDGCWSARRVSMSRSARRLMSGSVYVPADCMG